MKNVVRYACQECGNVTLKWQGQCHACGEWNTIVEEPAAEVSFVGDGAGTGDRPESIGAIDDSQTARLASGIGELDRVLGGGFVPGSSVLLGGEPGIGKSTLLLQAAAGYARSNPSSEVLLVSAEESKPQVRRRAERIDALAENLLLYCESSCERIAAEIQDRKPAVAIIDSIQTIRSGLLSGAAGSVGQVRECAALLASTSRASGTSLVMVGHVTKDGALAGPRTLEHLVDSVLAFEGDRRHGLRSLRAEKNRFGPSGEVSLFEMEASGLVEVADASARLIRDRRPEQAGSVIAVAIEGHRPVLVEIQALVSSEKNSAGRRGVIGIESQRVSLIVAVLESRAEVSLGSRDLYVSVAGGIRVEDPGVDLAVALAIASAASGVPVPTGLAVWGELGLGGELRLAPHGKRRHEEATRLGFSLCMSPNIGGPGGDISGSEVPHRGGGVISVDVLEEALDAAGLGGLKTGGSSAVEG
ncbi:MAG: DNA repair protein RadA [Acidobacteria bacterium]|nr:MAG: DNA repair protein RadA [Acidobacteriota bacterium]